MEQFTIIIECFKCNKKITSQGNILQNLKTLSYELKFHPIHILTEEICICEQCNNEYENLLKENEKKRLDFFKEE